MSNNTFRPIAIHLPQYHPIPENDEWWGKGFTEWTNVARAKPLFKDHYQPHLPSDLGFYDLRLKEARMEQEKLAKENGIYGFCYYHYWFNGKLLLQKPIEEKLKNPEEDLPFMLCWANENWTRVWDGGEDNILMEQNYNFDDHIKHIEYLLPFFKDPRYIKINDKAVFAVYRSTKIPEFDKVCEVWKETASKNGVDLYIIRFETFNERGEEFIVTNLDASAEFQPHIGISVLSSVRNKEKTTKFQKLTLREKVSFKTLKKTAQNMFLKIEHRLQAISISMHVKRTENLNGKTLKDEVTIETIRNSLIYRTSKIFKKLGVNNTQKKDYTDVVDYKYFVEQNIEFDKQNIPTHKVYSCVSPGFDNSARKSFNYFALTNATPDSFRYWVIEKLKLSKIYSEDENLFFINAWNEWAEGNHLEPDQKWGKSFLEVIRESFKD